MRDSRRNSQKGFSALSIFIMILGIIILMSFTGFFVHPISPVADQNVYHASGSREVTGTSLHMVDVIFDTPAPSPTQPIPTQAIPTQGIIPTAAPTTVTPTSTPTPTLSGPPTATPTPAPTALPTHVPAG